MRTINKIILHCTATPEDRHHTVADIDRWHKQRGFKKIGYHYLIYLDGSVHIGREESEIGAHTSNHNANSIGICYVGGCDKDMKPKDTRTYSQRIALRELVYKLQEKYKGATVHGHYEFAAKACPSFKISEL